MTDDNANRKSDIKRVQVALALTGTFMLVEVAGGILSGSLALLADAGHMLTATMALALSAIAFRVISRPASARRYHMIGLAGDRFSGRYGFALPTVPLRRWN